MKILDLLSKLGILRKGAATWKGDASKRSMPFIDDGIMNAKKDITSIKELKSGGIIAKILSWLFGVIFLLLGLILIASSFISGLIAILLGLILLPPIKNFIRNKLHFNFSNKFLTVIFIIGIILFAVFIKEDNNKVYSFEVPVREGQATEEGMKNLTIALGSLAVKYKEAIDYQNVAAAIPYGLISVEDARLIIAGAREKWDLVEQSADNIEKLSFPIAINQKDKSYIINSALAQSIQDEYDAEIPLNPGEVGSEYSDTVKNKIGEIKRPDEITEEELIRRKWEMADLARLAYPNKDWLTIVQVAFKADAQNAKKLLDERNADLQVEFKNEDDYNKRWVQGLTVVSTGGKVVLYVAAAPEAIAAGGVVAAGETLLAGVDVAFSVGDSVNVMMNDGEEPLIFTQAKEAIAPLLLLSSIKNVLQNPSEWKKDTILSLYDTGAFAYDELTGFTLFNNTGDEPKVDYYDQSLQDTFGPDGSGNEYVPPYLKLPTKEQKRKQLEEAAVKFIEKLKDPEYRNALIKLEEDRTRLMVEKLRQEAEEQKRIEAEKKAQEQKALEEAKAAQQKEAMLKLKTMESRLPAKETISTTLEKPATKTVTTLTPTPIPTPKPAPTQTTAPTPTPTPAPAPVEKVPANTVVGTCSVCAQSGLDCACGREACRCCAPGDSGCNAYDL